MKVSAAFNGQGLELVLHAETEAEKRMVGAVLNQPFSDPCWRPHDLDTSLIHATVHYDGHWTGKAVERLVMRVHRQEGS